MPQDILINLFTSIAELLWLSVILSIPMFFGAIAIKFINAKLSQKFDMGFARASFISTYLLVLLLIIVLYFYPLYLGFSESPLTQSPKPPFFEITAMDFIVAIPTFIFKFLLNALVFTILILPVEFIAVFVIDYAKKRQGIPKPAAVFSGAFIAAIATVLIILFVFPFIPVALIQLLYFT